MSGKKKGRSRILGLNTLWLGGRGGREGKRSARAVPKRGEACRASVDLTGVFHCDLGRGRKKGEEMVRGLARRGKAGL